MTEFVKIIFILFLPFMCDLVRNKAEADLVHIVVYPFKDKMLQPEKDLEWKLVGDQVVTDKPEYKIPNTESEKDTHLLIIFVPIGELKQVFHEKKEKRKEKKLFNYLESIEDNMSWRIKVFSVNVISEESHRTVDILSWGLYLQRQNDTRDITDYVTVCGQSTLDLDYYNPVTRVLFGKWNEDEMDRLWNIYSDLSDFGVVRFYDVTSGKLEKAREFKIRAKIGRYGSDLVYQKIQKDFKYASASTDLIFWIIGSKDDLVNLQSIRKLKRLKNVAKDLRNNKGVYNKVAVWFMSLQIRHGSSKSEIPSLISQLLYEHKPHSSKKLRDYNIICTYEGNLFISEEYDDLSTDEIDEKILTIEKPKGKPLFAKEDNTNVHDMSLDIYEFENGIFDQYGAIKLRLETNIDYKLLKIQNYSYMEGPTAEFYLLPLIISKYEVTKLFGSKNKFWKYKLFSFVRTLIKIAKNKLKVQLWSASKFEINRRHHKERDFGPKEYISEFMEKQSPFGAINLRDKMETYSFVPYKYTYVDRDGEDILTYKNTELDDFWAGIGKSDVKKFDPVKSAKEHPFELPGGSGSDAGGSPTP